MVIHAYEMSLDLDIAMVRSELNADEQARFVNDEECMSRITLIDFDEREKLITNMRALSSSNTESIKLQATLRLGEMLYKDRFKQKEEKKDNSQMVPDTIVLMGAEE